MRVEVMEHYGLTQSIEQAGYYETAHHKQLMKDIKGAIREGRLIAVCGVVGSGKTVTLRRLQQQLLDENKIIVARSLSVDKQSVRLATLINALFYDLAQDKQVQIHKQGERRERELQELVKKGKRPVALFVDEAHDLNGNTLTGLKRLMEVVEDGGGRLSVVLAGHPKLRNDLRRPTMEEIGYRTDIFTLDGITGSQREYIQWLLKTSTGKGKPEDILTTEAVDLLAMEAGYQTGEKPITATLVESVLSRQLDDLEPTLTRHGYRLKDMVEQFDAKPAEIRALFNNQLDPARTAELRDRMLAVGLPI
ncbi:type II secretion system protein [Salmonella enterica subsp. enterica serovar Typhimurium str. DT104]|nr:type II secretion system protein [Salmonella enterica subsp. enterica serovar Typhimurium str. DT104]CQL33064.1 type II secretion system protein [Salmonella enterica subsp. enterica serovar Typhimurium str. DT104]CQL59354.1 type II secretion system protein [Salmonella enterica subsp. enterica serovar Typhimurium str. DT104]CQL79029.1 type II secretion system protein [Salmonella enterica subsp. enterica serovar Typhimurium str. DT104]CQN20507.1 type II secretion system protein [Salmonella ent